VANRHDSAANHDDSECPVAAAERWQAERTGPCELDAINRHCDLDTVN